VVGHRDGCWCQRERDGSGPGEGQIGGRLKLFARKFDLSSDPEVLDLIDACLLARA
jgi:hypothetical protein